MLVSLGLVVARGCSGDALATEPAQGVQRDGRSFGHVLERPRRCRDLGTRRIAFLHPEPREPPQRRALVSVWLRFANRDEYRQCIAKVDLWQLGSRGTDDGEVAGLERPLEAAVGGSLAGHERMFAQVGTPAPMLRVSRGSVSRRRPRARSPRPGHAADANSEPTADGARRGTTTTGQAAERRT